MHDVRKTKTALLKEIETLREHVSDLENAHHYSESDNRFRVLVQSMPDAVRIYCDGVIVYVNAAAVKLFGARHAEEIIGRNSEDFVPENERERLATRWRMLVANGNVPMEEQQWLRLDGSLVDVEILGIGITWHGKAAALNVIRDISSRVRGRQALIEAKENAEFANRTKSDFLANISHEIRTPLNAIMGFSEVMEKELFGPVGSPRYREYAADIHASGQHLASLINYILDLSKIETGQMRFRRGRVNVVRVVEASLALLKRRAETGEIKLAVRIGKNLPALRGDERRIRQVLFNLVSKASKFTPDGGKVSISASANLQTGLRIRVNDTGIGMKQEDLKTALTPFGQVMISSESDLAGTGLGLPLAKTLVEHHGGSLDLKSKPGEGTKVTLEFPPMRLVA
ncbi:MAG: PAS domain-containing sensor histidine kinase [Alphaproteobacteria bacterium]